MGLSFSSLQAVSGSVVSRFTDGFWFRLPRALVSQDADSIVFPLKESVCVCRVLGRIWF